MKRKLGNEYKDLVNYVRENLDGKFLIEIINDFASENSDMTIGILDDLNVDPDDVEFDELKYYVRFADDFKYAYLNLRRESNALIVDSIGNTNKCQTQFTMQEIKNLGEDNLVKNRRLSKKIKYVMDNKDDWEYVKNPKRGYKALNRH